MDFYYIIPPIPPISGPAGIPDFSSFFSANTQSVVNNIPATSHTFIVDNVSMCPLNVPATIVDYHNPDIVNHQDYYAFGAFKPGTKWSASGDYRYSFNGKENDPEAVATSGGTNDFGDRIYNPSLGRFLSIDPLTTKYPESSPYAFAANSPISLIDYNGRGPEKPVKVGDIRKALNDGKEAKSYMLIVYVDQPDAGKRDNKTGLDDVGHTFIQLIKYNKDGTTSAATFGYYPEKKATPYDPHNPGQFGDNSGHDYDEAVIKGITAEQFNNILNIADQFEKQQYCLFDNNCTDFGIKAAKAGGLTLPDSQGKIIIPMGGNHDPQIQYASNPADLGQDIVEQKSNLEKQKATVIISKKDDNLQATDMNKRKK